MLPECRSLFSPSLAPSVCSPTAFSGASPGQSGAGRRTRERSFMQQMSEGHDVAPALPVALCPSLHPGPLLIVRFCALGLSSCESLTQGAQHHCSIRQSLTGSVYAAGWSCQPLWQRAPVLCRTPQARPHRNTLAGSGRHAHRERQPGRGPAGAGSRWVRQRRSFHLQG